MSNYVWHKVICRKEVLDQYFIGSDPFGDGRLMDHYYISFNKLFGVKSLNEYSEPVWNLLSSSAMKAREAI